MKTCNYNCSQCPFTVQQSERILVYVVGHKPSGKMLDFGDKPAATFEHRGYSLCFVNFCGESVHIGREIRKGKPDIVLNNIDSMALEEQLRITARLIDMDAKAVLSLDRYDELLKTEHSLDYSKLGEMMGFPALVFESGEESFSRLLSSIVDAYEAPLKRHIHVPYGQDLEKSINRITELVGRSPSLSDNYHDRYLAVRLLEEPKYIIPDIEHDTMAAQLVETAAAESERLSLEFKVPAEQLIREARHGYIHGALQETLRHGKDKSDHTLLQRIDSVLTNRWIGLPLLVVVLFLVFEATFFIGAYPQGWIENGIELLSEYLHGIMPSGWLTSMLLDGVLQGCGTVISFVPNIMILFFFLSILEDSGYMARAAFLMDKIMHKIGLHGNSFVPMLIGFGCNVPAIMAARSIDDKKDRTLTMLMIPFMSCSARLPVYMLFIGAFFPTHRGLVMISLYLVGVLLSIVFAFIMKHTKAFRRDGEADSVSELPAFRGPTWRNTWSHIWERTYDYLQKITTVILASSVIIWALEYFPADKTQNGTMKEESYLAMVGRGMEPVMQPLGFDWRMNVCLLTGLPAKEAIVSTMGILYHTEDEDSLAAAMTQGAGMNGAVALAFLLFVLLYFPCVATIAALRREVGGRWAAFSVVQSMVLAWLVAFIVYNVGKLLL